VNSKVLGLDVFIDQVVLGRPAGLLQSAGGRTVAAKMRWYLLLGLYELGGRRI